MHTLPFQAVESWSREAGKPGGRGTRMIKFSLMNYVIWKVNYNYDYDGKVCTV